MVFSLEEDYKGALFEGPYILVDQYLLVKRWRLFFLSNVKEVTRIPTWIRIPKLPLDLYTNKFLWRVGS